MNLSFLKSPHGEEPVILESYFKASTERVFRAWTETDEILQWFGPKPLSAANINLQEGGLWEFRYDELDGQADVLHGEYVEIQMNQRLVFTWNHRKITSDGEVKTTPTSLVTITFTDQDNGTLVRLLHEQIILEDGRLGVGRGWNASFERLSAFLS